MLNEKAVLIVDDDDQSRKLLSRIMRMQFPGSEILEAEDGLSGAISFLERTPWLVISDYRMPQMFGSEMLERIRGIRPDAQLLLVSDFVDSDLLEIAKKIAVPLLDKGDYQAMKCLVNKMHDTCFQ